MSNLCGIFPPAVTIFKDDGNIDYPANQKIADFLIESGADGIAYLGTSGEFASLTIEEKRNYLKAMTEYVKGRAKVIAGVGDTSLKTAIELGNYAKEVGVDALLVVNPYFNVYPENMVEAYFDEFANSVSLPIIIYNFPGLTGYCFDAPMVERLATKHSNIIGIKDTIGDPQHLMTMIDIKNRLPDFKVFSAFENQAIGMLINGIDGFINATANFAPEFTVNTVKAFKANDMIEAGKWYKKMCEAMAVYDISTPLYLACKEAVYQRVVGYSGFERLPATALSKAQKTQVTNALKKLNLL